MVDDNDALAESCEGAVLQEFDANSALGKLILNSFFPLTCMVPLEDRILAVREELPASMKNDTGDVLLQETIRTFHVLIAEKDDEIGQLKNKLKQLGAFSTTGNVNVKFVDVSTQSELDMTLCSIIEKQMTLSQQDSVNDTEAHIAALEADLQASSHVECTRVGCWVTLCVLNYLQELGYASATFDYKPPQPLRLAALTTAFIKMRDEVLNSRQEKMRFLRTEAEKWVWSLTLKGLCYRKSSFSRIVLYRHEQRSQNCLLETVLLVCPKDRVLK